MKLVQIPFDGFEGIYAGTDGWIYSCRRRKEGTKLKPRVASNGYRRVNLYINKEHKTYSVHRLVCTAFNGVPSKGCQVRHLDGDKANNVPSNLKWGSPKENAKDKTLHGTSPEGNKNPSSKLTERDIQDIRELRNTTKLSLRDIGGLFGVSKSQVCAIVNGKAWFYLNE